MAACRWLQRDGARCCSAVSGDGARGSRHHVELRRFPPHVGKCFCAVQVAESGHRSPRGSVRSPSLEVPKPTWAWCWAPALGGPAGAGWHWVTPEGLCPPQTLCNHLPLTQGHRARYGAGTYLPPTASNVLWPRLPVPRCDAPRPCPGPVPRAALSLKATTPRPARGPQVYKSRRAPCPACSLRSAMALLWLLSCLALAGSARAAASAWGRGWAGRGGAGLGLGSRDGAAEGPVPRLRPSRRLRRARHRTRHPRLQPHRQRGAGGARLLALAGVPAGLSPSCGSGRGQAPEGTRTLTACPQPRAQPQLCSPFSSPDPYGIPLLRRLPDQRVLGGHGCPLRIQVRSDALRHHQPQPHAREQPRDRHSLRMCGAAPKGPSSPRLPPQLPPWHPRSPRGCRALGPGAGCHGAP